MRRKDREMSADFALQLLDKAQFCIISVIDLDGNPYGFPISFARKGNQIFIHSAKKGKKVEIFEAHPKVSITCVGEVQVPNLYTEKEMDELVENNKPVFGSKVYTTEFESAIFEGKVSLVTDDAEKIEGLRLLCEKYTPDKMKYFDYAIEKSLPATLIYSISIENITGKRKKFDAHGEEMKHGRME